MSYTYYINNIFLPLTPYIDLFYSNIEWLFYIFSFCVHVLYGYLCSPFLEKCVEEYVEQ